MTVGGRLPRGSIDAFVGRHVVAWEGVMGVLAVLYLVIDVLADEGTGVPVALIAVFAGVFFGEFMVRFLNARSHLDYLRHHWLDLVSSIPLVGGLRAVRLLRLVRLTRAARAFGLVDRQTQAHGKTRGAMSFVLPVLLMVWFCAALVYWTMEHGSNPDVRTFGDALYWAFLTLTTVGYGTQAPLHSDTRILAGALIFIGIGLVSFASGRLTALMLRGEDDTAAMLAELRHIRAELHEMRLSLAQQEDLLRLPGD
jgi:voltage-gated potassium channel